MVNSYSYMNEDEIDDELICAIGRQAFNEPVSSMRCHHTFCKRCIDACLNQELLCPVCRSFAHQQDYQSIRSRALINQLNRLRVCCNACQARNIQRIDFQDHIQNCPNWVISCTAEDIRCAWQGMRNQLAKHVRICPFQQIRPIVDDLRGQIQSNSRQINDLKNNQFNFVIVALLVAFFLIVLPWSQKGSPQPRSQTPNFLENLLKFFSK